MRLAADGTHKSPSDNQHPIRDAHAQHGKSPRRGSIDHSGTVLRVELCCVIGAEERIRISLPHRHGASLVCTDCRIRHNTVGRIFLGVRTQLGGVKPDDRYLIEKRTIPDDFGFRINGVRQPLRTAERKIFRLDDLSRFVTEREHQSITALRPSNFWIVSDGDRESSEDKAESQRRFQQRPPACRRCSGRSRNLVRAWSRAQQASESPRSTKKPHSVRTVTLDTDDVKRYSALKKCREDAWHAAGNEMRSVTVTVLIGTIIAVVSAARAQAPSVSSAHTPPFDLQDPGVIEAGARVFSQTCTHYCHAKEGRVARAPALRGRDLPVDYLYERITKGAPPMPAYGSVLSQDDLWKVIAYVRSLAAARD